MTIDPAPPSKDADLCAAAEDERLIERLRDIGPMSDHGHLREEAADRIATLRERERQSWNSYRTADATTQTLRERLNKLCDAAEASLEENVKLREELAQERTFLVSPDTRVTPRAAFMALSAERDALQARCAELEKDADLYRQWYDAVQDLNPSYLKAEDRAAMQRIRAAIDAARGKG